MATISEIKQWLTLDDAAVYLSSELSEDIKPADILQLGLEDEIPLSVYLPAPSTL